MPTERIGMTMEQARREWHLDRNVTLGLIGAVILQVCTFAWYASAMWSQIENQQKELNAHTIQINAMIGAQGNVSERLARVETQLQYQNRVLDRIEEKLPERKK